MSTAAAAGHPPFFGGNGKGWQPACQALILAEVPAVPQRRPLLLAQKLPELGEYAREALSTSLPEDSAITNDFIPPALRNVVCVCLELRYRWGSGKWEVSLDLRPSGVKAQGGGPSRV